MKPRSLRARTLFLIAALGSAGLATAAADAAAGYLLRDRLAGAMPAVQATALAEAVRTAILLAGTGAAAVALILGLALAGAFTGPLRGLRAGLLRRVRGADGARIPPSRITELDALARAIDLFAHELAGRSEHLDRERSEMALLLNSVSEGIVQIGPTGRIVRLNPAARTLLGLPAESEGRPVASLVRHAALRRVLERAVEGEPVAPIEVAIDERRLLVAVRPLAAVGATPDFAGPAAESSGSGRTGAVAAFVDLTELRRLEDVRREFVANASHELKSPLTSIRGYIETLLDDDPPPELRRRFLETVRKNTERLHGIVEDLLDLSRLESGGWRPAPTTLDVPIAVEEAWTGFRETAASKGIALEVAADPECRVSADSAGLRQVLSNLFDNALRHTGPAGRITVRVRHHPRHGRRIAIEVRDDGSGIPSDALPRIFERFYRVDPARSRAEGGTGLGLSIVRHLVESMGGEVTAESELGKGTTIRIDLPAATSEVLLDRL